MLMTDAEQFSSLVGDIYDAALDPSQWDSVLTKCARFIGGSAAALFAKDAASKTGGVAYEVGIEPYYKQLYFDKVIKYDPLTIGHYFADVGEPVAVADIMPYDEFLETRAYREWGLPQGLIDTLNVALDKTVSTAAFFAIFRHERDGRVDDGTRQRMRLIVPHMRRAVLIGRVLEQKMAEAAHFADTLDGLSVSMFLVDARGLIVHANAAGHALLADGSVLYAAGRKLAARDLAAEQALYDVFLAAGSGDAAVGIKGVAVPLMGDHSNRYLAHVLPLTSGARRRTGASYAAVAALVVRKATLEIPAPPEVIAKTFKLTPSELRALLGIVEVGGIPETAEALGISENTLKTHLRRLFDKTGTSRQADLVKLIAGYFNPLVAT
jgi:DNA-binding CsgD family transcriptional regulator